MFVALLHSLAARLVRAAKLLRSFALLEDAPVESRTLALASRPSRTLDAHRVPLAPARPARRAGAVDARPAVCLTPVVSARHVGHRVAAKAGSKTPRCHKTL